MLQVADGRVLKGVQAQYFGMPVAYGWDPVENIVYNGCHDNETIFDQVRGVRVQGRGTGMPAIPLA